VLQGGRLQVQVFVVDVEEAVGFDADGVIVGIENADLDVIFADRKVSEIHGHCALS
jgi:hypothetical protein